MTKDGTIVASDGIGENNCTIYIRKNPRENRHLHSRGAVSPTSAAPENRKKIGAGTGEGGGTK